MTDFLVELDFDTFFWLHYFGFVAFIVFITSISVIKLKYDKKIKCRSAKFRKKFTNTQKDFDAIQYIFNSKDKNE